MQHDQAVLDVPIVLAALIRNHPQISRGSSVTLAEDEPQRAGLNKDRFDAVMWWLIEHELLERDEQAEHLSGDIVGLSEYDYGIAFKLAELVRVVLGR